MSSQFAEIEVGLLEGNGNHRAKRAWILLRVASADALEKQ